MTQKIGFCRSGDAWTLKSGETTVLTVLPREDCEDRFTVLETGAWLWERHTSAPTSEMRMEFDTDAPATFTMIPAVSYNGNGWGDSPEYLGDRDGGIPWTFAWHRCTIPACTYSEWDEWSAALMAEENDAVSCSQWREGEHTRHALIWPEQEGPRVLMRHYWEEAYSGAMKSRCDFQAVIHVHQGGKPRMRYPALLDFAWRHYAHSLRPSMPSRDLYRFGVAYFKSLWTGAKNGFCAFNRGLQWYPSTCYYAKRDEIQYEIGWVGQNASISCALLWEYLRNGDKDARDKAITALDSWVKFARLPNGLMLIKFDKAPQETADGLATDGEPEERADTSYMPEAAMYRNGIREFHIDACNLGGAAQGFFEAEELTRRAGISRPEYRETAMGICNFVRDAQKPNGSFAKSWNRRGEITREGGTVGCFLIPPLLTAYRLTGDASYLESARRGFDFYYRELDERGFTTAGALDTYCIDKESSSPLLAAALALYRQTKENAYLEKAENVAWYLSTWMMHYKVHYPENTVLGEMNYDTFGMTAVSTAHNAIDQYALHDVLSFLELAKYTGNIQWKERAMAFWCSTTQLVSDGTLCIAGRVRPAGSQDEAVFHTRWGRKTLTPFQPSQWLVAWPCAFRMEILRTLNDWSELDRGMKME